MNESPKFKVSVWNAFVPETALIMARAGATGTDEPRLTIYEPTTENSGLQTEVFSWRMLEDAFGGIEDDGEREKLKAALLDGMDIGVDPKKRSIAALRAFVEDANGVLATGGVEWSGSQSFSGDDDEERRVNPLLALVNHLSWLIDVFEGQPNVSIIVR